MKYILSLAFVAVITLVAMPLTARTIPFSIDAAQFKYDSAQTLWELYYSFPDSSLKYVQSSKHFVGELYIKTVIYSTTDTVSAQAWIVTNTRDSLHPHSFKSLIGQKLFVLKPGQYTASIQIMDVNDTASHAESKFPVIIRSFPPQKLAISDIEIVTSFSETTAGENSPFKKGTWNITPNPAKEYISTEPHLLTYSEIYNAPGDFKVRYTVLDGAKNEIFSMERIRQYVGAAAAETITLPLEIIPSGAYYIQVAVFSPSSNHVDSSFTTKKFYILNPNILPEKSSFFTEDQLFLSSEFATMNSEKIQSEFEKAEYTALPAEVASFKSLSDIKAKQKFMYQFWAARDSDTSTIINEALEEFRKQVAYASTYFSNVQIKEGWRTDRGRVRLKYGAPAEVNRSDFNVSGKPYEIWTYNNMQGGNIIFCFVDLNGYNNHKLVHSTALGEVRDERWMERYVRADNFDPNGDIGR